MAKYSFEFKLKVVKEYLKGEIEENVIKELEGEAKLDEIELIDIKINETPFKNKRKVMKKVNIYKNNWEGINN